MSSFCRCILLFTISATVVAAGRGFSEETFDEIITTRIEKTTHLHFYFHDTLSGKNPSAKKIVGKREGPMVFGDIFMIDDALTEGPESKSKVIGRAQGMYAFASQDDITLLMVINYEFIEGIYNGSSLSILGRNPFMNDVREMPIVGGNGIFRFAKGYALAHTFRYEPKSGDAVVEYNVYVQHE